MVQILPSKTAFIKDASAGKVFPLYVGLPFIEPQRVFECLGSPYSFLLESMNGPEKIARYSFIGTDPFLVFKVKNGVVGKKSRGQSSHAARRGEKPEDGKSDDVGSLPSKNPLRELKQLLTSYRVSPRSDIPPFTGGAVGLISYDFVHYFEHLPRTAADDLDIPDAHFMLVDTVVAVDHVLQKTFIITCPGAEDTLSAEIQKSKSAEAGKWEGYYDRACEKIRRVQDKISSVSSSVAEDMPLPVKNSIRIRHEMEKDTYMSIVRKAKEYIRAGDIFQANLSQRVSANIGSATPWQVYQVLSTINPSPFAAYLDMGNYHIASSSPERLVRVSGSTVETRPIAGTRPRGRDAESDRQMRADLLLNEKERAEHLMLIDLERNDLGKISDYSTVQVDEFMVTEHYSHVIHIVSNIKGTLAAGKDCFDAIRATFPGGTITGVPKVRCMEIIDELEPVTRGPYTGSVGYISFTGDMDLNIIIRTFVIKDNVAYVQAGAGIVADSDPEREYYETLKKAEALVRTLESL